jgi:hypothetical protein
MADPKQLRVLKKLVAHIEGINPDNVDPATGAAYTRDLRGRVYRGRSLLTIKDAEDAISILEFPRQEIYSPVGEHGIVRLHDWSLMVQGWPADDPVNPSDPAYDLLAMVEMRLARLVAEAPGGRNGGLYPDEYKLGMVDDRYELASLIIAPGIVRPPEDAASRLAMFYMPLVLGVRLNVADPYGS